MYNEMNRMNNWGILSMDKDTNGFTPAGAEKDLRLCRPTAERNDQTMNRREAREAAFQLLFSYGYHIQDELSDVAALAAQSMDYEPDDYIKEITKIFPLHREEIDEKIGSKTIGWNLQRLSRTAGAILRLAVCEMLYIDAIPLRVSINEAIELAKKYGDDAEPKFVNGILNAIADAEGLKKAESAEALPPQETPMQTDAASSESHA